MRRLVLSLLFFSVNSIPQDLYGRFLEESDSSSAPTFNLEESARDSTIIGSPALIGGAPDLFSSTPDLSGAPGLTGADDLGEPSLFSSVDGAGTSSDLLNPPFTIAALPENPATHPGFECTEGSALACCFMGRPNECIWYHENDPGCFYENDFRCCQDISDVTGIGCKEATQLQPNAIVESILDVLRTPVEVPEWLPLLGDAAGAVWNQ